jgi:hypothetical protein
VSLFQGVSSLFTSWNASSLLLQLISVTTVVHPQASSNPSTTSSKSSVITSIRDSRLATRFCSRTSWVSRPHPRMAAGMARTVTHKEEQLTVSLRLLLLQLVIMPFCESSFNHAAMGRVLLLVQKIYCLSCSVPWMWFKWMITSIFLLLSIIHHS